MGKRRLIEGLMGKRRLIKGLIGNLRLIYILIYVCISYYQGSGV